MVKAKTYENIIAEALRQRGRMGISQEKLAEIAEVSTRTIARFETGEEIKVETLLAILGALDIGLYLYPEVKNALKEEEAGLLKSLTATVPLSRYKQVDFTMYTNGYSQRIIGWSD